ncbi:hypothetical protein BpHYR1_036064 [Brachionus plicatilis]|uniref:Uncharacterized protein n=1 Tax=Brachionus plicatilis TaxID=10195 RepID=A0A3M7PFN0_BRAPC|nr:hypothetical protein BpHYR1_036064 [Brachionus plicatilis]
MGFLRSGTVVLSTVFVYFDVNSLIECWKSKHPSMAQVEEIIKNFKEQLVKLKEFEENLNKLPKLPFDEFLTDLDVYKKILLNARERKNKKDNLPQPKLSFYLVSCQFYSHFIPYLQLII